MSRNTCQTGIARSPALAQAATVRYDILAVDPSRFFAAKERHDFRDIPGSSQT